MCGIVGYAGREEPQDILLAGLEKLEYRGYDSAGIAVVNEEGLQIRKAVGPLANLRKAIGRERLGGKAGIGHTRWATHGAPSTANAHPHIDMDGTLAVVHNGTIENYAEKKEALLAEGVRFRYDTDTEVAVMLLAKHYRETRDLKTAMDRTTAELKGTYVLVAVAAQEPDRIVAHRRNAPLIAARGKGFNLLASDFSAVLKYAKDVYLIENGDTVVVTPEEITIYDEQDRLVKRELMHIGWDAEAAEKGGFPHFMLKEIHEQPRVLEETVTACLSDHGQVRLEGITFTREELNALHKICIVACGTAYHAGLVGKYVIEKLARIPVDVDVASEFRYRDPFIDEKTLFIAISQSGETADTLEALREAKRKGARILSIVNVVGSSVARESEQVFYTHAGPEIAVASTKAYTTQLASLYLLALYLAEVKGVIAPEEYEDYVRELRALPDKADETLRCAAAVEALARDYYDRDQVFYIGRGLDSALAYEGSLKLKEISYISSFAIAAGEMKHGTIAIMEPRTIVLALATQDRLLEKMISNIQEVKARNAHIIAFTKETNPHMAEQAHEVIFLPVCRDELMPLLAIIPLQLYAYYVARNRGCEIDKPRNLAKSVTVE